MKRYTIGTSTQYGSSGFNASTFPTGNDLKYIDVYSSTSNTQYMNRKLGDATGEIGPFSNRYGDWFGDYGSFDYPWFIRGGIYHAGPNIVLA